MLPMKRLSLLAVATLTWLLILPVRTAAQHRRASKAAQPMAPKRNLLFRELFQPTSGAK